MGENAAYKDILSKGGTIQLENLQSYSLNAKVIENGYGHGDITSVICNAVDENGNPLLFPISPIFGTVSTLLDPKHTNIVHAISDQFSLKPSAKDLASGHTRGSL